ncbi:hypothetical protein OCU04_013207 [Sclerotinia nivalis]|uniref:Uncharacterized protein n=1 Tax=Sclerotinia nivalis TaxID=352851 RepID=A0A9X0A896_9HELO|nr:hypothetical protein OCU04_013207 [Sclerotinia nivalis]
MIKSSASRLTFGIFPDGASMNLYSLILCFTLLIPLWPSSSSPLKGGYPFKHSNRSTPAAQISTSSPIPMILASLVKHSGALSKQISKFSHSNTGILIGDQQMQKYAMR